MSPLTLAERQQFNVKCACGCGGFTLLAARTSAEKGWVKGEPQRWLAGHNQRPYRGYAVEDRGFETPCWIWQGTKQEDGYGRVIRSGRAISAHRWYWEQVHGEIDWSPSGDALELDHLCRNPPCVNPDHLQLVSRRENMLRGENAIAWNARKTHCKNGHPLDGDNLVVETSANGRPRRRCRTCQYAAIARYQERKRLEKGGAPPPND